MFVASTSVSLQMSVCNDRQTVMKQLPLVLLFSALTACLGYKPWECPTELLETERVDCHPEQGADQYACEARNCVWCETYQSGLPWCFHNTKPGYGGTCRSTLPMNQRAECWPYLESSNARCVNEGCVWCPVEDDGVPWCFHDDTVPTNPPTTTTTKPTNQTSSTTTTTQSSGGSTPQAGCPSLIDPNSRVDCYPEAGSSQAGCEARGCIWCSHSDPGVPWCSYPDQTGGGGGGDPGTGTGGTCPSEIPEEDRIDCYPDLGSTEKSCEARLCIWCEASGNNVPWCFFNSTGEGGGKDSQRINCAPDGKADKAVCEARGCLFMGSNEPGAPICFFPEDRGYSVSSLNSTPVAWYITLQKVGNDEVYSTPVETLKVIIEMQTNERIHIKITDAFNTRFEVPLDVPSPPPSAPTAQLYDISITSEPVFSFTITRKATGEIIYDTSLGGLVFEDQYLQIATRLPNDTSLYGIGETEHHSLKHSLFWQKYGMYARDQPPYHNWNLYGTHPFYMAVDGNFDAHGVLILNSNAQDFEISPSPYIVYRTIGGVLDIYVFAGPTPEDVVSQYTEVIGRPYFPPYWSLGFQLCRYGYNNLETLQNTVERMRAANIPYDVQYGDIDYMDQQRDFTTDPVNYVGLDSYVDTIKSYGMHYIIILDPCIDYTEPSYAAYNEAPPDIWIRDSSGVDPISAKVWPPGNCYFPDYTNPATEVWWVDQCVKFRNVLAYDGIWIDMNEPANFVEGSTEGCLTNTWNFPPYKPKILGGTLADKTLCPDAVQSWGRHYDVHNLFGYSQSQQTLPAARQATGKRSIVISRSTFPGSGKYSGHWLGDNYSQWTNLHYSIIGCLEFNLFGIPYIGADICGFNGDTNEQLCQRWMQLGAFYTFSRNHNGLNYKEQDPPALGAEVTRVSRETLEIRYTLLPYLYTLFYHANVDGHTVMRPVFHEFYTDTAAYDIDRQFLWGPAFLISPVLDQDAVTVDAYFPDARWYDYYTGTEETAGRGETVTLDAPMDYIPLHVRGGYILPTQEHAVTTTISRTNPMGLIIALDDAGMASGDLYWDDGDEADAIENGNFFHSTFRASANMLTNSVTWNYYPEAGSLSWGTFRVMGVAGSVSSVAINGASHGNFVFNTFTKELTINNIGVPVVANIEVSWS